MDFSHAVLTPTQIETARNIFRSYADTCTGGSKQPTHMGILSVLQFLATIGVRKTENEVKDFIMAVSQSSTTASTTHMSNTSSEAVKQQQSTLNASGTLPRASSASGRRASSPSQSSTTTKGNKRKTPVPQPQLQVSPIQPPLDPTANTTLLLSFEGFLALMLFTFENDSGNLTTSSGYTDEKTSKSTTAASGDCEKLFEMKGTFSEIDRDGDGVISSDDLRQTINRHFVQPYNSSPANPHRELTEMSEAQLMAMLRELDIGNDGIVNYQDFLLATETA